MDPSNWAIASGLANLSPPPQGSPTVNPSVLGQGNVFSPPPAAGQSSAPTWASMGGQATPPQSFQAPSLQAPSLQAPQVPSVATPQGQQSAIPQSNPEWNALVNWLMSKMGGGATSSASQAQAGFLSSLGPITAGGTSIYSR